jgi:hypothetical protein
MRITHSKDIDLGVLTSGADFLARRKSWEKLPVVKLEIMDDTGEWRYVNLRPVGARALAKGLNKMSRIAEELDQ